MKKLLLLLILCVSCFLTSCVQYKEYSPANVEYKDINYNSKDGNYKWEVDVGNNSYIVIKDSVEFKNLVDIDNSTIKYFECRDAGVNWDFTFMMWVFILMVLLVILGLSALTSAIFD